MSDTILEVKDLHVSIADKPELEIVRGADLQIRAGEIHALMGPNGSGKSTLANTIAGSPAYAVDSGQILFQGQDVTEMPADERARLGMFLSFQYPTAIPGVTMVNFLREALKARTTFTIDILNYRKDGTPFMNRLRIRPLFDDRGELMYFVGAQNPV